MIVDIYNTGGVVSTPLKHISQLGLLFPKYGKIKNVPNHQPVIVDGRSPCQCSMSSPRTNRPIELQPEASAPFEDSISPWKGDPPITAGDTMLIRSSWCLLAVHESLWNWWWPLARGCLNPHEICSSRAGKDIQGMASSKTGRPKTLVGQGTRRAINGAIEGLGCRLVGD